MPENSKFKKLVRARMERTGETYTQARDALVRERDQGSAPPLEPSPGVRSIEVLCDGDETEEQLGERTAALTRFHGTHDREGRLNVFRYVTREHDAPRPTDYRIFLDATREIYAVVGPIPSMDAFDAVQEAFNKANGEVEDLAYQFTDEDTLPESEGRLLERGLRRVDPGVIHPAIGQVQARVSPVARTHTLVSANGPAEYDEEGDAYDRTRQELEDRLSVMAPDDPERESVERELEGVHALLEAHESWREEYR